MPYDFETTPVDGYLRFTASGTIESAEEAMAYLESNPDQRTKSELPACPG